MWTKIEFWYVKIILLEIAWFIKETNQKIFTFQNVNTSKCKIRNVRVQQHNLSVVNKFCCLNCLDNRIDFWDAQSICHTLSCNLNQISYNSLTLHIFFMLLKRLNMSHIFYSKIAWYRIAKYIWWRKWILNSDCQLYCG